MHLCVCIFGASKPLAFHGTLNLFLVTWSWPRNSTPRRILILVCVWNSRVKASSLLVSGKENNSKCVLLANWDGWDRHTGHLLWGHCLPPVTLSHEAVRSTPGRKRSSQSPSHGMDTATFWPQGLKSKVFCATFVAGITGKHTEGKTGLAVPRLFLDHHPAPVLRVKC